MTSSASALTQAWWQRAPGTSTVHVFSRRDGSVLELANIHHGPQLALILQLRATELFGDDTRATRRRFLPERARARRAARFCVRVRACARGDAGVRAGVRHHRPRAAQSRCRRWSTRTTIRLRRTAVGARRRRSPAFMEREVMPFARHVLGPLVGGADNVTCETCHGSRCDAAQLADAGRARAARARAASRGARARAVVARSADAKRRLRISRRGRQTVDRRVHAPGRDARHGEADASPRLRLRASPMDTTARAPPSVVITAIWSSKILAR